MAGRQGSPSLTVEELEQLQTALAEGRRATVYLREPIPSLDLPAGSSARVVSIDGTSVLVRPRGVDDELPFEANELRATRRAPEPAPAAKKTAKKTVKKMPETTTTAKAAAKTPAAKAPVKKAPAKKTAAKAPASAPARTVGAAAPAAEQPAQPATRAAPRSRRSPAPVSVTIESTAEGGWTVAVHRGARRLARPAEVSAQAVLRALRELGDDTALREVEAALETARAQAAERVAALAAELDRARRDLDELGSVD